jgi:hypothetical protein
MKKVKFKLTSDEAYLINSKVTWLINSKEKWIFRTKLEAVILMEFFISFSSKILIFTNKHKHFRISVAQAMILEQELQKAITFEVKDAWSDNVIRTFCETLRKQI